jgi:hypothetical protein
LHGFVNVVEIISCNKDISKFLLEKITGGDFEKLRKEKEKMFGPFV